jgi:uncharacterized membrane protein YoaK (UPF0700 family)
MVRTSLPETSSQSTESQPEDVEANFNQICSSQPVSWWQETVNVRHADLVFILCCLITGLCDSFSYLVWYCFLSMQTGNTVFLGLGSSSLPPNRPWGWAKSLVSIVSFFIGAFVFSSAIRRAGVHRRGTLCCSFSVQCLFILIPASLVQGSLIPHDLGALPSDSKLFLEFIPISLLAFQFGGQIATSRAMGFSEIPTVVLTSVYCDIASDPNLTAGLTENVKRNRRLGSVTALLIGVIASGWLCRSGAALAVLWISTFIKFAIAIAWLFWPLSGDSAQPTGCT